VCAHSSLKRGANSFGDKRSELKIVKIKAGYPIKQVKHELTALGLWTSPYTGAVKEDQTMLVIESQSNAVTNARLLEIEGVEDVLSNPSKHPLMDKHPSVIDIKGVRIGDGAEPLLMAGPCSVESEEQIHIAAQMVYDSGAKILRGGCFKPRTNPYSFQGVGVEGLKWMRDAADKHGLLTVTEAMAPGHVDVVAEHSDIFQIGARNMQNFDLLHAVGRAKKPVLLKRGLSATISEWLQAAEHLLHYGAESIILCERGVRSFDGNTRFLFDLAVVAMIRHVYKLPIIADPSHATGRKELIGPMGAAALAAGAHGLIIETHPDPGSACSDAAQQLNREELLRTSKEWGFSKP